MKIKCPVKNCVWKDEVATNKKELIDMLEYHRHGSIEQYAKLIIKIYEKIEAFDQALDHHYTNDDVIQELKSLLECER